MDRSPFTQHRYARELIDHWWRALPPPAQQSIAKRFVNKRREQHLGALFELYMATMCARLFSGVTVDVEQQNDPTRSPDLFVLDIGSSWSIEATTVTGDDVVGPTDRARVGAIYEAIELIRTRHYLIAVNLLAVGSGNPGRRNITAKLGEWLQTLDIEEERSRAEDDARSRQHLIEWDGWRVQVAASPWRDGTIPADRSVIGSKIEGMAGHKRVIEGERTIEIDGPRNLSDDRLLAEALRRKAKRRQNLAGRPWVLAVMCAGDFVSDREIVQGLLGSFTYPVDAERREILPGEHQPGGLWHQGDGWRYERVSAVLTVRELTPLSIAVVEPTVWLNPLAEHPLPVAAFPWRTMHIARDRRVAEEPSPRPAQACTTEADRAAGRSRGRHPRSGQARAGCVRSCPQVADRF